jgi:hypothetical protein
VWRIAAASVTGTSHAAAAQDCQDSYNYTNFGDASRGDVLLVAVADGAGSAKHAKIGSSLVAEILVAEASNWYLHHNDLTLVTRETVSRWLDAVRDAIGQTATANESTPRDFASTALLAIADQSHAVFVQLGDGAIVARADCGSWNVKFWPQHGEYANQTNFVTDETAHDTFQLSYASTPIKEIVLFTDGLERVLLNHSERSAHAPAFEKMLGPLRASEVPGLNENLSQFLAAYLTSPPVTSRADDDLTLFLASQ